LLFKKHQRAGIKKYKILVYSAKDYIHARRFENYINVPGPLHNWFAGKKDGNELTGLHPDSIKLIKAG
jgi:hypothetical protein